MGYQGNSFEIRSPSKSVHLAVNNESDGNKRVNNNFRVPNNPFTREVSRSKNNERQQVLFRSVDMRGASNNHSRNQGEIHSPLKQTSYNNGNNLPPSKFDMNSPGVKRPEMISSLRPMSSHNQPVYVNSQGLQNGGYQSHQPFPMPFNGQNYQLRVFQAPQENVFMVPSQQINNMGKSG
jgi:hypothetical protein